MSADRLVLEGMRFFAHHGDVEAERELGSRIDVDVEVAADLEPAGVSDALVDTLDYVTCYQRIREIVENRQFRLLEGLARAIADDLLTQQRVTSVRVRVAKQPPIAAAFERVAVVIERGRGGAAS